MFLSLLHAQNASCKLALVKYNGGGDWYANLEKMILLPFSVAFLTLGANFLQVAGMLGLRSQSDSVALLATFAVLPIIIKM